MSNKFDTIEKTIICFDEWNKELQESKQKDNKKTHYIYIGINKYNSHNWKKESENIKKALGKYIDDNSFRFYFEGIYKESRYKFRKTFIDGHHTGCHIEMYR